METIDSPEKIKSYLANLENTKSIALIPTMGKLHPGHIELIKTAKTKADIVIVSNFINTIQFGLNEHPDRYPQNFDHNNEICKTYGVDLLFIPSSNDIYPPGFSTFIQEENLTKKLSGPSRQALFKGYATSIIILLNLIKPHFLILGQKDIHQTNLIKKIIRDLMYSTEIIVKDIVRDSDGLAYSTSNEFLEDFQRQDARKIFEAIQKAKIMVENGTKSVERIIAEVTHHLTQSLRLRIVYIAVVNPETMETMTTINPGKSLLTISVWVDQMRLNDNIIL